MAIRNRASTHSRAASLSRAVSLCGASSLCRVSLSHTVTPSCAAKAPSGSFSRTATAHIVVSPSHTATAPSRVANAPSLTATAPSQVSTAPSCAAPYPLAGQAGECRTLQALYNVSLIPRSGRGL